MRTVAVHALAVTTGAVLCRVPTWRALLPEPGDAVRVVRLDGSRERWTGRVTAVDRERRTYTVAVGEMVDIAREM